MPRLEAQAKVTALMYSRPFSDLIAACLPRHSMIRSSERVTRTDGSENSTSMPKPWRLKSSVTLINQMLRPSASCYEIHRPALIDQSKHCQRQRFLACQAMTWLDPQLQFELAVDRVDALVVPFEAFTLSRHRKYSPKSQLRWSFVSSTSQSAMRLSSASSFALYR